MTRFDVSVHTTFHKNGAGVTSRAVSPPFVLMNLPHTRVPLVPIGHLPPGVLAGSDQAGSHVPACGAAESSQPRGLQPMQTDFTLKQKEAFALPTHICGFLPLATTKYQKSLFPSGSSGLPLEAFPRGRS